MSKLFIELYLDENIDHRIGKVIESRGFKVFTTDDFGRKGADDPDQLRFAAENGLAILTMNRIDFEHLAREYFHSGQHHSGIIIVADDSPYSIAVRVINFMEFNTADEVLDQLIYL